MPDWLNPWWQMSSVIPVPIEPEYVSRRFQSETRARISAMPGRRLTVTRTGRYLGGYLRTVATLTPNASNTEVTVAFSRPRTTIWLMVGFMILGVVVAVAQATPLVTQELGRAWRWSDLFVLSPLVSFGVVFAVNHAFAMEDARHLHKEIECALTQPPKNFWRALAKQT